MGTDRPQPTNEQRQKRPRSPKGRARETAVRLAVELPGEPVELCELNHTNAFELLAATVLSAQCTDERVNMVTPTLFARYPMPFELAGAESAELEEIVRSTGFYASKARNLIGMAAGLVERFDGEVPTDIESLISLPGVGRKTANLMRAVVFDLPGIPVDTHVKRTANRLELTDNDDPTKIEHDLGALLPRAEWGDFGLRMILHGRRVCVAKKPLCGECVLENFCPSSQLRAR